MAMEKLKQAVKSKATVIIGSIGGGIFLLILLIVMGKGCTNPETRAGYEGYVFHRPYMIGKKQFATTQIGQTSYGFSWRMFVINVDMRPRTYSETFEIMTKDHLVVKFNAHLQMKLKRGTVKTVVEQYDGKYYYRRFLREPFRNAVYDKVKDYVFEAINAQREAMGKAVEAKLIAMSKGTPFQIIKVVIGNILPPSTVREAIEFKLQKEQELLRKSYELKIAAQDAKIRVTEANGIAQAQQIIANTLTAAYLQYLAIKAQQKMADSPNHTTVYIPSGASGIPIIHAMGKRTK